MSVTVQPLPFENAILVLASGPLFAQNCLASLSECLILIVFQGSAQMSEAFPDHAT